METPPPDVHPHPSPECPGAWRPGRVWGDEQLVRQEEVREGRLLQREREDREGLSCGARVWAGNRAAHGRVDGQRGWRGRISGVGG